MTETPIVSARDLVEFQPPGSPRRYTLAPLTFRERLAYRAAMTREAGEYPSDALMFLAMRGAVRELEKRGELTNAAELLTLIEAVQAAGPEDVDLRAQGAALEMMLGRVPAYNEMIQARQRWMELVPFVAARHALRGWDGPGLPEFARVGDAVPEALMEALYATGELQDVGWRAQALMQPGRAAEGNSASPSPSPAAATPAKGETSRKKGASGSSSAASGTATPAG